MTLLIVAWMIRRHGDLLRRHAFVALVGVAACVSPGSASGADFKSLLADAGSIVFGGDDTASPIAPEPDAEGPDREPVHVAKAPRDEAPPAIDGRDEAKSPPDVLKRTPRIDETKTGRDADTLLRKLLPGRSDTSADWYTSTECLHAPGEPRALSPCIPPPPCDPSTPPHPFDLVGVAGAPSCGPIYRGPCEPRSARNHHGVFAWCHHLGDRLFDCFYRSK